MTAPTDAGLDVIGESGAGAEAAIPVAIKSRPLMLSRRLAPWLLALALGLIPILSHRQSYINVGTLILIGAVGAIPLNMLQGLAGQLSVGNAAFMAVGGFTTGAVVTYWHTPFLVALPMSAVAGAIVGAGVGVPALRVRGLYLLLATLAFQYVSNYAFGYLEGAVQRPGGYNLPEVTVASIHILSPRDWYVVWLIAASVAMLILANVARSRVGRAWMAIRQSESMAASMGINVPRTIVTAFSITSAMIAVQGSLYVYFTGVVQANSFTLTLAIQYLAIVLIGGEGFLFGPLLGAVIVEGVPFWVNGLIPSTSRFAVHNADIQQAIYGLLIIVVLVLEPEGVAGLLSRSWRLLGRAVRLLHHGLRST